MADEFSCCDPPFFYILCHAQGSIIFAKEHFVIQDLSKSMYAQFKESLTQVPELERKLSEAKCNLATKIAKAKSSRPILLPKWRRCTRNRFLGTKTCSTQLIGWWRSQRKGRTTLRRKWIS